MAPRLSGQTSLFGVVFFVSKSLLGIETQKKLEKFASLTRYIERGLLLLSILCGRQGVQMVCAPFSRSSGPGSSPDQRHRVVFLG